VSFHAILVRMTAANNATMSLDRIILSFFFLFLFGCRYRSDDDDDDDDDDIVVDQTDLFDSEFISRRKMMNIKMARSNNQESTVVSIEEKQASKCSSHPRSATPPGYPYYYTTYLWHITIDWAS